MVKDLESVQQCRQYLARVVLASFRPDSGGIVPAWLMDREREFLLEALTHAKKFRFFMLACGNIKPARYGFRVSEEEITIDKAVCPHTVQSRAEFRQPIGRIVLIDDYLALPISLSREKIITPKCRVCGTCLYTGRNCLSVPTDYRPLAECLAGLPETQKRVTLKQLRRLGAEVEEPEESEEQIIVPAGVVAVLTPGEAAAYDEIHAKYFNGVAGEAEVRRVEQEILKKHGLTD